MRMIDGRTDVPTAATRVQLSVDTSRVRRMYVRSVGGNVGVMYFGGSLVANTRGWELAVGGELTLIFEPDTISLDTFYADTATNGNDLAWIAIVE